MQVSAAKAVKENDKANAVKSLKRSRLRKQARLLIPAHLGASMQCSSLPPPHFDHIFRLSRLKLNFILYFYTLVWYTATSREFGLILYAVVSKLN
jgi:hypothetical protein